MTGDLLAEALLRTLGIGFSVALCSGFLAILFSWLLVRTDLPGARFFEKWLSVPYSLPAYLLALAWMVLGNPTVGLLKDFLPSDGITSLWGIIFVETSVAFVFPFLELTSGFRRLDPSLEEAARLSGATPLKAFLKVGLPLLFPALLSGMMLSFLYAISSFGVPALLGMPARKLVVTTLIYSQFRLGGSDGLKQGLLLSLGLLAVAVLALALLKSYDRYRIRRFGTPRLASGKSSRHSLVRLGRYRYGFALLPFTWITLTLVLPWGALALSTFAAGPGRYQLEGWSFSHLQELWQLPLLTESVINSLGLALTIASLVTVLSFWMGFKEIRRGCAIARTTSEILLLPFASPGSTIALLWLTATSLLIPGFSVPLLALAVCCALKYFAIGIRAFRTAFAQIDPVLEESARLSGAGLWSLLGRIWAPLLSGTATSVFFLVSMPVFTELTMSVLLTGPGASTLGTLLFQLQEYANPSAAAALAFVLLTVAMILALTLSSGRTTDQERPSA